MTVLPSAYLPPVSWFASIVRGEPIFIEQHENYQKQTIRNRCTIDSPNGALHLSIPINRSTFTNGKCPMKDIKISTHTDWQRQHWYAIETTYFNSPFFEYLQDDFRPFYNREWTFLMDFNEALIYKCMEILDIQPKMSRTVEYTGTTPFAPSEPKSAPFKPYYQVFQHKHGFLPDLSIIDLIFNMGNESILVYNDINV